MLNVVCFAVLFIVSVYGTPQPVILSPGAHAKLLRKHSTTCTTPTQTTQMLHRATWLERVDVLHTYNDGEAIIDCVNYLEQPGLIDASVQEKRDALHIYSKHYNSAQSHNGNKCGAGSVGVVRFRNDICVPSKRAPPSDDDETESANAEGYNYVVSPRFNVPGATEAYGIFGVGVHVPLAQCNNNRQCHSLNQFWWLSQQRTLYSLEVGWIASNYFTSSVTTSIFAFSTNDGYAGDRQDQYNLAGGFIAAPSSPVTLGAPLSSVQLQIAYKEDPGTRAFILWVRYFEGIGHNAFSGNTTWQAVGHYPYSRYPNGINGFTQDQSGCEVYHTTNDVKASGRILGWGTDRGNDQILNAYRQQPQGTGFTASYSQASWTPANNFSATHFVTFTGGP